MKNYGIKINGKSFNVGIESVIPGSSAKVMVNGREYIVQFDGNGTYGADAVQDVAPAVPTAVPQAVSPLAAERTDVSSGVENVIVSPLPGVIIGINVNVGDKVKAGQCLVTLEAMKMENAIEAECDGTVKKIFVRKGDSILEGAKIIMIG